jgi:elongation factor G
MLEQLADHDDELLEQLLMDEAPEREKVLRDLARETGDNLGVSVLFGSAVSSWGVRRLLKAMRHEAPAAEATASRLGVADPALYVFKVIHGSIGRLALSRAVGGRIGEGSDLKTADSGHARVGSLFKVQGEKTVKVGEARDGDIVAVAKIDSVKAGQWLGADKLPPKIEIDYPARNCAIAIEPADRKDDVKLSGALQRLGEEDAALIIEHDDANHEIRLRGVNDEHLNTVIARLKRRYGVEVKSHTPTVGYRESIRKLVTQKGRHKKQSGGHGQFGDVIIEVKPLPRGSGFVFEERIHGGSVPKQWIPAVEDGVREAMRKGPLGFEVVDCAVTLVDGSYHSVDSSELAFRLAGRIAMQEALTAANPHLLEPMHKLSVVCPSSATSRITSAVAGRRGQMLGMGPRDGWTGWDRIDALIPEAELSGLEAELRSQSQGLATYEAQFDHLAELNGPLAEKVIQQRVPEPA